MNTQTNTAVKTLDQITREDEPRSGGKAFNCARLKQAGFRVPDGIVVLSTATNDDLATVSEHPWFDTLPADTLFAVRSSGIGEDSSGQSFAGIHQTILNVQRADVRQAVLACQESGRSRQALQYRRAKGISTAAFEMGVLIQQMIQPVAAGVAFTVNPVSGADNELVINSSWGVGEGLVSGQVDPDEFVISKQDRQLLWSRLGEKSSPAHATLSSLSPEQIQTLSKILLDIEHYYGTAQDVEWCHDGADFWVVQSRPITTSGSRNSNSEVEWTRANLVEVLPDLTSPQALSAFQDLLNKGERQYMGKLLAPDDVLGPILKSFYGRLYFNLSQLRRVCAIAGTAPAELLRSMGHADAIQPADEKPARLSVREKLSGAPDLIRIIFRHLCAAQIVRDHEVRTEKQLRRLSAQDPRSLTDSQLWSTVEEWFRDAPDFMQAVLLLGGVVFHEAPVRKVCEKVGFPFERLVYPQLATGERSVSAQQAYDLIRLANTARRERSVIRFLASESSDLSQFRVVLRETAFLAEFECFLEKYGHRGHYESDWSLPRYSEDPTPLLRAIRAHIEDVSDRTVAATEERQRLESQNAWAMFEQQLSPWQKWTTLPRMRRSVQKIKQYYIWRERVRSDMVRVLAAARKWHLVLADRFVERGWLDSRNDYFLLHLKEIAAVMHGQKKPETLRRLAADRILQSSRFASIQMPLLMRESQLAQLIRIAGVSSRTADETELTGHPVSGGCVEAEVVVVRDPNDFSRMKSGAILVAPATDPSWTPLFTLASGVIVEVGGVLSHASTIAREYGLPALANVKHATKRLKTGERVRLDATNGVIQRLS